MNLLKNKTVGFYIQASSPRHFVLTLTDNLSGVCICTGKIRCEDPVGIRIGLCIRCIAAVSADWSV